MIASNRAPLAAVVAILLGVVAARCSEPAGAASNAASGQSASTQSSGDKIEANLTDLPTYPNLTSGSMLGHPPKQGAVYNAMTNDSYDQVLAWYRSRLAGAREVHSGYYDSTKGKREIELHLTKWNEQVMLYADPTTPGTSIALGQDAH
jgi:hypothetical protein